MALYSSLEGLSSLALLSSESINFLVRGLGFGDIFLSINP